MTWVWLDSRSGVQYRTAAVDHGDINVTVSATGNPNAVVTVQVGSQVSGNILALVRRLQHQGDQGRVDCADRSRPLPDEGQSGAGQPRRGAGRRRQQPGRRPAGAGGHSGRRLVARRRPGERREGRGHRRGCQGQGRSARDHGRAGRGREGGSRNRADDVHSRRSPITTRSWRSSRRRKTA